MSKTYRALIGFLPKLWSNWITLLGAVVVTVSAVTILAALAIDLTSAGLNAYAAAILFLVVPALLGAGLLLIPLGLFLDRRRVRRRGGPPVEADSVQAAFTQAMASGTVRRRVAFVLLISALNVLIFSTVTYRAVTFMETPKFCGNVCHTVMQPEFDAYNHSPHSHVACVECHIGAGAAAAADAKLAGLRRVWGVATGRFQRPIEPPHNLRPASETCGGCHQPNRQEGTRVAFRVHFKADEANTPQVTAMMVHIGGEDPQTHEWSGIHAHASTRYQIRYEYLDNKRQTIGKIQKVQDGKVLKEWLPPKDAVGTVLGTRTMDCTDCHNRATHVYDGTPENAVTQALADGRLDRKVPWLYQVGVRVLQAGTPPRDQAEAQFHRALEAGYDHDHPQQKPSAQALDQAARGLAALYQRNVYPVMQLSWNKYPSEMGHGGPDPGNSKAQCFRCHSGDHLTADGQELSSKCGLCHEVVAKDERPEDLPDELRPLLRL
jgi:NapC/NirT cytochrome c family, N-terminal region